MRRGRYAPERALGFAFALGALGALAACHHDSASDDVRADGEKIFASVCSRCHGADGKGGVAAGGTAPPRNFCDHAFQASHSDQDLKTVIRKGKGAMPAFGDLFSEGDLSGLVQKIRSFDPKGQ